MPSLVAIGAAGAAFCLRVATYSSLALRSDALEIRNLFRARVVALATVAAVTPGYYGITIATRDGHSYTAFAVQKGNLNTWLGRHTRADEVATAVRRAAGLSVSGDNKHRAR